MSDSSPLRGQWELLYSREQLHTGRDHVSKQSFVDLADSFVLPSPAQARARSSPITKSFGCVAIRLANESEADRFRYHSARVIKVGLTGRAIHCSAFCRAS
jgi:hypothetical protein